MTSYDLHKYLHDMTPTQPLGMKDPIILTDEDIDLLLHSSPDLEYEDACEYCGDTVVVTEPWAQPIVCNACQQ